MALETEGRRISQRNPLIRLIEQRTMGYIHIGWQAAFIDRETVVLRGDQHPSVVEIDNRVIGAVMAEFHFQGLRTGRQAKQLMTEANSEQRNLSVDEGFDLFIKWWKENSSLRGNS